MGILGDLFGAAKSFDKAMNGFVNDSGVVDFGMKYQKDIKHLTEFYHHFYYAFGLTSPHLLDPSKKVPLRVHAGWDGRLNSFEIRGNISQTDRFTGRTASVFHTIIRNWPTTKGGVWVFDITRLHEGILSGQTRINQDGVFHQSEEYLKVLRIIGASTHHTLSSVPQVGLQFGPLWEQFGIPDRIDFRLDTLYPLKDADLMRIVNLISHSYHKNGAPVSFSYSGNPATGTMIMTPQESVQQQPQSAPVDQSSPEQTAEFVSNLNAFVENHSQNSSPEPDDGFPYEFYRGLGLIDSDDTVLVDSILGPMRLHMTQNGAKAHLLTYRPED